MSAITFINENEVETLLKWDTLIPGIEKALSEYSKRNGTVIQPTRLFMSLPEGALLVMPGFLKDASILGCKIVTSFPKNDMVGLPSILGNVMLFDSETGKLKVVIEGTHLTGWRTAAASAVATKHIHKAEKNVLAILGAGTQGKSHALAFHDYFKFKEIRIWNRTAERAKSLCEWLGSTKGNPDMFRAYNTAEECVSGADVIITATYSNEPILKYGWLKDGVHINAIGAGIIHHSELEKEIYDKSEVIVDSIEGAKKELKGLFESNTNISGEIGEIINGKLNVMNTKLTVFQSMGMAVEDVAAADLVYKEHKNSKNKYTMI